jgi:outer membrane protein insertion porin family
MIIKRNKALRDMTCFNTGYRLYRYSDVEIDPWNTFLASVLFLFFTGCTGLRHIRSSDPLYTGYEINIINPDPGFKKSGIKRDLKEILSPKPNKKFLWMRPSVAVYEWMGNPKKEKGVRSWIKKNFGEPPVLLSTVLTKKSSDILGNRLFNLGYFNSKVSYSIQQDSATARVFYSINPGINFKINKVTYESDHDKMDSVLRNSISRGAIKAGQSYDLNKLIAERERVEYNLKDSGYYYFNKDYILFEADTISNKGQVDLIMKKKNDMPITATKRFRIGELKIMDDNLISDTPGDTSLIRGTRYISSMNLFRPEIILDQVLIKKGAYYSKTSHYYTINHLMNLGLFKYVNISFDYDSIKGLLNPVILMTPSNIKSITAEINANVKTTNYVGPGLTIGWKNRNIFKGAEQLSFNLTGSFEVQVGADTINTSLEGGFDINLDIPRIVPFHFKRNDFQFMPGTTFKGGVYIYKRVELYTMNSFFTNYGFHWRRNQYLYHQLNFADISYNKLSDQTPLFQDYLEQNPTVRKSFEEQFIIGFSYMFAFDRLLNQQGKVRNYISGSIESSGNFVSLISGIFQNGWPSAENQYLIFGIPYSQYLKTMIEYREYFKINNSNYIATRGIIGVGTPYGNSSVIPYIRQFYSGGTNSVRAFVSRSIGPGSYYSSQSNLAVDQTGDVKLEYNLELRHSFSKTFKSALFVDAGNVWLWNNDPERPGGSFQFDRFYKEFAVGGGLGLRFDFDVTVVRFDFAWPLYKPYLEDGKRWIGSDTFNSDYRKSSPLVNFALGYPF